MKLKRKEQKKVSVFHTSLFNSPDRQLAERPEDIRRGYRPGTWRFHKFFNANVNKGLGQCGFWLPSASPSRWHPRWWACPAPQRPSLRLDGHPASCLWSATRPPCLWSATGSHLEGPSRKRDMFSYTTKVMQQAGVTRITLGMIPL